MTSLTAKTWILTFLVLTIGVFAQADSRLVGTWTQDGEPATWTFRADGSGFIERSNPRTTARFTWNCQGVRLQVSTAGLIVPYTLVSSDGNTLVLRNERVSQTYHLTKKA